MTRWQPCPELTFLLEALSRDIIAATDDEVGQAHGRSIAATGREVRRLIQAARGDNNQDLREDLSPDPCQSAATPRPTRPGRRPSPHQRH